jgi:hypothetical protein
LFAGFEEEGMQTKLCKPGKKKSIVSSWESPYVFVGHKDGKGIQEQDEGGRTCIIKNMDDKHWE